jgi:hypothetical protein
MEEEKGTQLDRIFTKFKEIKDEAEHDLKIDRTALYSPSFNVDIHMRWLRRKTEAQNLFKKIEIQRKEKYRTLFEYYKTDYPLKLGSPAEYQLFIESDENYVMILNCSLTAKELVDYISAVLEAVKARAWEIKNFIDYQRFQNGQ